MIHSASQIKLWGIKQIFVTIKTCLFVRGYRPLNPPFQHSAYVNKMYKNGYSVQNVSSKNVIGFELKPMSFFACDFFYSFVRKSIETSTSTSLSRKFRGFVEEWNMSFDSLL